MKKAIVILSLLICAAAQGQKLDPFNGFGGRWNRGDFSVFLNIPFRPDTLFSSTDRSFLRTGSMFWHTTDTFSDGMPKLYVFYNNHWAATQTQGVGGSGTDNTNTGSGFRVLNAGTQQLKTFYEGPGNKLDTTTNSGGITVSSKSPVFKNLAELRGIPAAMLDTGVIYFRNTTGVFVPYKWDNTSTETDDSVTVIQRTGTSTGRFKLYFENYISVDWFGAVAGDGVDDSYPVQKAINFAISSPKSPKVWFSGGNYIVNNVAIVKRNGPTEYSFVTATLKGKNFLTSSSTNITCTDTAGFSFAIYLGRNVKFDGLTFNGQGPPPSSYEDVITWTESQWTNGVRNNGQSPHTAIAIDPFSQYITSGNRYPNATQWYTNFSAGGTSQVDITNCAFKHFPVAISVCLGNTQNGDNITVSKCYFEGNKNVWATGQTQSRANVLEKSYMLYNQFIVNARDYGQASGTAPLVSECNIAGGTKYLYYLNSDFAGATFNKVRTESLWSFGKSINMAVNFTDCEITLSIPGADGAFAARLLAEGKHVAFKGGSLEWFDNTYAAGFPFSVVNLSFDGTSLRGLPVNYRPASAEQTWINKTTYQNVQLFTFPPVSPVWGANVWKGTDITDLNNSPVHPGTVFIENSPSGFAPYYNVYKFESAKIENILLDSKTLNIDSVNNTAYFLATNVGAFRVNDMLSTFTAVSYSGDIYSSSMSTTLGWVYAISGDTVKLKYVPYGLNESDTYTVYLTRVPKFIGRTFGDVSSGSNVITGVTKADASATFVVGAYIKGTGIPAGTRVTAVTSTTITLSRNATGSASATELYDAVIRGEGWSDDPLDAAGKMGWTTGDFMHSTRTYGPNSKIYGWVCTSPGFTAPTATPVAQWQPVYLTDDLKANLASPTFTGTVTVPTATAGDSTGKAASTAFVDRAIAQLTALLDTISTVTASTTNATPANVDTLLVPAGYDCLFKITTKAENKVNNEVLTGEKWISIKNVAGTYTITRALYTAMPDGTSESNSLATASWTVGIYATLPVVQATGIAATNIKWTVSRTSTCAVLTPL